MNYPKKQCTTSKRGRTVTRIRNQSMHPYSNHVKSQESKPFSPLEFLTTKIKSKDEGKYNKVEEGKQTKFKWTEIRDKALVLQKRFFPSKTTPYQK